MATKETNRGLLQENRPCNRSTAFFSSQLPVVIGLAYIVITDKWEEHRLRIEAAAQAESDNGTSDIPDTDIEGNILCL